MTEVLKYFKNSLTKMRLLSFNEFLQFKHPAYTYTAHLIRLRTIILNRFILNPNLHTLFLHFSVKHSRRSGGRNKFELYRCASARRLM